MKNAKAWLARHYPAQLHHSLISLWYWLPFLLISAVTGSAFYIMISTGWQLTVGTAFRSFLVFVLCGVGSGAYLWPQIKAIWSKADLRFRPIHFWFFVFAGVLLGYRSTMYYDAVDDFVFHMIAGFYIDNVWISRNVMPMDLATYLYPLLQVPYAFLTEIIGIRLTLTFLSMINVAWLWHLHARFAAHFFPEKKDQSKIWILDLFFVYLFFFPELVLTHQTFMSDFYSVLFALEVLYVFVRKGSFGLLGTLMMSALLIKQSSGLFFIPLFLYFGLARIRSIKWRDIGWLGGLVGAVGLFHWASFWFSGNPLSFLMNSVFQSPLYPLESFRDWRWGPQTVWEKLVWPVLGPFTTRYIEFPISLKMKPFFSLFVITPFVSSLGLLLWKRKVLSLVTVSSFVFWSLASGYGRYMIGMCAVIFLLNLFEVRKYIPSIPLNWKTFALSGVFCLACFTSFRQDYAWRGFYLQTMLPPVVSSWHSGLFWQGFGLLGRDRPQDIARSLPADTFSKYDQIAVFSRGISTYYAFLAERYAGKPVVTALTFPDQARVDASEVMKRQVSENLEQAYQAKNILLLTEPWSEEDMEKSIIFMERDCTLLDRYSSASAFQKPEYFSRVVEYECQ